MRVIPDAFLADVETGGTKVLRHCKVRKAIHSHRQCENGRRASNRNKWEFDVSGLLDAKSVESRALQRVSVCGCDGASKNQHSSDIRRHTIPECVESLGQIQAARRCLR